MGAGGMAMVLVVLGSIGILAWLVAAVVRSIQDERSPNHRIWKQFSLGLVLMLLFFLSWGGQLVAQWQEFTDEQRSQGEAVQAGDFMASFMQSTLENWQSEFLQLFSFVVLAALYIHKGSSESKDGQEKLEASLRRLEERLGTLPANAPIDDESWKLPDSPADRAG